MFTITNILEDIQRGITANNLNEDYFSYRIVFFVNDVGRGTKFRVDTPYGGLRSALENIIKKNLTTTNCLVIAAVTTLKNEKCISLLSRSYPFSLDGYFKQIVGKKEKEYIRNNCGRRLAQWC